MLFRADRVAVRSDWRTDEASGAGTRRPHLVEVNEAIPQDEY